MKKTLSAFLIALTLMTSTLYSPKSEALVGLIFKNKIIKTIGGAGAIAGGAVAGGTLVLAATNVVQGWGALGVFVWSSMFAGLGLVILDDDSLADIEFRAIAENNQEALTSYSLEEIQIYNSELELLNSIKQTITAEVGDNDSTEEAEKLWLDYSEVLHPVTFEIAKDQARQFLEAI